MVARPSSPLDEAASAYLRGYVRMMQLTYPYLQSKTHISQMTLRRYISAERTMTLGDFLLLMDAIGLEPEPTIAKIRKLAREMGEQ